MLLFIFVYIDFRFNIYLKRIIESGTIKYFNDITYKNETS